MHPRPRAGERCEKLREGASRLGAVASAIRGARRGSAGPTAGVSQGHPKSDAVAPDRKQRSGACTEKQGDNARGFISSLRVTLGTHGATYRSMHVREDWVAVCCGWPMGPGADGRPFRSMQGGFAWFGLPSGGGSGLGAGVHRPRAWRGSNAAGLAGPRW